MRKSMKRSRGRRMRGGQDAPGAAVAVAAVAPGAPGAAVAPGAEEPGFFDKVSGVFSDTGSKVSQGTNLVGSKVSEVENKLEEGTNAIQSKIDESQKEATGFLGSIFGSSSEEAVNPVVATPVVAPVNPAGGRRRRRSRQMKGGISNSAFGYYAAPVTDSVTAQPTYMMKYDGGRRRKTCKRKGCKKRKSCRHRSRRR